MKRSTVIFVIVFGIHFIGCHALAYYTYHASRDRHERPWDGLIESVGAVASWPMFPLMQFIPMDHSLAVFAMLVLNSALWGATVTAIVCVVIRAATSGRTDGADRGDL